MKTSEVYILKTDPGRVIKDYSKLLHMAGYDNFISRDGQTILKLNLSWTKYFPACSTPPWQLEGVVKTLIEDGYDKKNLFPVENKTVVTDPVKGSDNNKWTGVLKKYDLPFIPLTDVKWMVYQFKSDLLRLPQIFPEGIEIPEMFIGKNVIHLPTMKTHGHSITTGAVKNAFGGLLKEFRHYGHKYIHEVMVDLMLIQKEIHPGIFSIMDASVCGDGAGPRTLIPRIKNYILASADSVALDAIAARMMGFKPLEIPYLKMCHEMELGTADPERIEVFGEDISEVNFNFRVKRSPVIRGDQMLRRGKLRFLEGVLLHSPLIFWAPLASNIYHDLLWYPLIGKRVIKKFSATEWGKLFEHYD